MGFRLRHALIFATLMLLQTASFAQDPLACEDMFATRSLSFADLENYRVFVKGTNEVFTGVYVGDSPKGDAIFDDGKTRRVVSRDGIIEAVEVEKSSITRRAAGALLSFVNWAQKMTNLIAKPMRKLTPGNDKIEVVGPLRSSKSLGETVFRSLEKYDEHMETLGFRAPEKTRVILTDRPLLPDFVGPFALNIRISNLWLRDSGPALLNLAPIFMKTDALRDESVLLHERTHSLLANTFRLNTFIHQSFSVQEALADFAAVHYLDRSAFAPGLGGSGLPMRDLQTATLSRYGKSSTRNRLMSAVEGDYHSNSLFISHLLWRVREVVGRKKMDQLFPLIVRNMNAYYESYAKFVASERGASDDDIVRLSRDIEFSLAVVERTAADLNDKNLFAALAKVAREEAEDLQFDSYRIDKISRVITKNDAANDPPVVGGKEDRKDSLIMHAYGALGFAIDAGFVAAVGWIFH